MAETSSILRKKWLSTPSDQLSCETVTQQRATESTIAALLATYSLSIPAKLDRPAHLHFLRYVFEHSLPAPFVALDASRPWVLFWILHSLSLLGSDLDAASQQRVIATLAACQNPSGGFGGGPGQASHLAPSYAAISCLAVVGTEEAYSAIDRRAMYDFLLSLKQPNGSFVMHVGGEVDVRGSYAVLSIATLLNLLTVELVTGASTFIASCQTYEGGLASSSFPTMEYQPLGESHGGYAFCAAASFALLRPFCLPTSEQTLDAGALLRWCCSMQATATEGGGFRGRTNKLVDGCYGFWNGGLFGILGALVGGGDDDGGMNEVYDRSALQEYVLLVAQSTDGGLRDKPGKHPDAYHTCYNLSGLSAAQHPQIPDVARARDSWKNVRRWEEGANLLGDGEFSAREVWAFATGWREGIKIVVGEAENELTPIHPLFNIAMEKAKAMLNHFYGQT